jgi:hypothetical protein
MHVAAAVDRCECVATVSEDAASVSPYEMVDAVQPNNADHNKVDSDDVVQQLRINENQNPRDESNVARGRSASYCRVYFAHRLGGERFAV